MGANTRAPLRVRPWPDCRKGSPTPAMRVRGYHPQKIFVNSDAKSCILVITVLISGLPRTRNFLLCENYTAKQLGDQYIVGPQPKSSGTSLPRSLRLLRPCHPKTMRRRRGVEWDVNKLCLTSTADYFVSVHLNAIQWRS